MPCCPAVSPASICPKSSQYFEDLLTEAGLPKGVYQNIYLDSSHAEEVLKDPRVKGFSLTGSEAAGASVENTLLAAGHEQAEPHAAQRPGERHPGVR